MADPAEVARIRAFLEQHRQTYHRSALHAKLLDEGHDPSAIEEALAQVYGAPTPPAPARSQLEGWSTAEVGIATASAIVGCLGTALLAILIIGGIVVFLRGTCPTFPGM